MVKKYKIRILHIGFGLWGKIKKEEKRIQSVPCTLVFVTPHKPNKQNIPIWNFHLLSSVFTSKLSIWPVCSHLFFQISRYLQWGWNFVCRFLCMALKPQCSSSFHCLIGWIYLLLRKLVRQDFIIVVAKSWKFLHLIEMAGMDTFFKQPSCLNQRIRDFLLKEGFLLTSPEWSLLRMWAKRQWTYNESVTFIYCSNFLP